MVAMTRIPDRPGHGMALKRGAVAKCGIKST